MSDVQGGLRLDVALILVPKEQFRKYCIIFRQERMTRGGTDRLIPDAAPSEDDWIVKHSLSYSRQLVERSSRPKISKKREI